MSESDPESDGNTGEDQDGVSKEDFSLLVHQHLNEYITLADNKASILLSAQLAFIGLSANFLNNVWGHSSAYFKVLSLITVLVVSSAAFFAAKAVYPNTPETDQGLILWSSIVDRGRDKYLKEIHGKSNGQLLNEVIDENHKLAKVTDGKYTDVRWTLRLTGATIILSIISGVLLFV